MPRLFSLSMPQVLFPVGCCDLVACTVFFGKLCFKYRDSGSASLVIFSTRVLRKSLWQNRLRAFLARRCLLCRLCWRRLRLCIRRSLMLALTSVLLVCICPASISSPLAFLTANPISLPPGSIPQYQFLGIFCGFVQQLNCERLTTNHFGPAAFQQSSYFAKSFCRHQRLAVFGYHIYLIAYHFFLLSLILCTIPEGRAF